MTKEQIETTVREECAKFQMNLDAIVFDSRGFKIYLSCELGKHDYGCIGDLNIVQPEYLQEMIHNSVVNWT